MEEFVEKLIERFEEARWKTIFDAQCIFENSMVDKCVEITKQFAEEYKGEWIPCSEKFPEDFETVYATCISLIDNREPWVIEDIYHSATGWGEMAPMLKSGNAKVIAWMHKELPKPYKGE